MKIYKLTDLDDEAMKLLTCSMCGYKFKDKDRVHNFNTGGYRNQQYFNYKDSVSDRWYIGTDIIDKPNINREYKIVLCENCFEEHKINK